MFDFWLLCFILFLENQIWLTISTITSTNTKAHCLGLPWWQNESHCSRVSKKEEKLEVIPSQVQRAAMKKRWTELSISLWHKEHQEAKEIPLFMMSILVGNLSCISFQTNIDFEGRISTFQMLLSQSGWGD